MTWLEPGTESDGVDVDDTHVNGAAEEVRADERPATGEDGRNPAKKAKTKSRAEKKSTKRRAKKKRGEKRPAKSPGKARAPAADDMVHRRKARRQEEMNGEHVAEKEVVYLFGAGASHACARAVGSSYGILMRDLSPDIQERVRAVAVELGQAPIHALANEVITESANIEQIITFLERSTSAVHQEFSKRLRSVFEQVLKKRLDAVVEEQSAPPTRLYEVLIDMHRVPEMGERLKGILTLNYDTFIEHAAEKLGFAVDYGLRPLDPGNGRESIRILKLHGSFGWSRTWPVMLEEAPDSPLWIPPGIQKSKDLYPFELLWGLAREMIDCDVLRVVGCNLGANDWGLIAMLFDAKHTHHAGTSFSVEIVDLHEPAARIQREFPYLQAKSLPELEQVGSQIISEVLGEEKDFADLSLGDRQAVAGAIADHGNPFYYWLKHKAELVFQTSPAGRITVGPLADFLEDA